MNKNVIQIERKHRKCDLPSFTDANLGSDREALIICGCLGGGGRTSNTGLRGLTTSHLT